MKALSFLIHKFPKKFSSRLKWGLKNLYYGSLFKVRNIRFDKKSLNESPWEDFKSHFRFVAEYYPASNILHSPMIQSTMFAKYAPQHPIDDESIKKTVFELSEKIEKTFNLGSGAAIGWLSTFGAIIEKSKEMEPTFKEKFEKGRFVEFGPGLGFAGQIYSKVFKNSGIYFDLPEVSQVRNICSTKLETNYKNYFVKASEFTNVTQLIDELQKHKNYSFISTWAFTEAPISVREDFHKIIENANVTLIISNTNFDEIDNLSYLRDLSDRLP